MKWPLAVSNFTILDKLKIAKWLLTETHWSQGEWVRRHEETWENYTGAPHAIMVSSGSAANHLIAYRRKWELEQSGDWPKRNVVVFPAVNWVSSVSPWIQLGFKPLFIDVCSNLCSSSTQVGEALKHKNLAAVFYTTLLGLAGDAGRIERICDSMGVPLYLDNCESSFSSEADEGSNYIKIKHICDICTCSTSFYFSHHTSGNQEGGMIFCQTDHEANWYRMARNHGMTRGMPDIYKNPDANPWFDFYLPGSNHRSSNLLAYMASLDFQRAVDFIPRRVELAEAFSRKLDPVKYDLPHRHLYDYVPLTIPVICREKVKIKKVCELLDSMGVEHRPVVGGNLLRHTAFLLYGKAEKFPRAQYIHNNGLYIGLHTGVTMEMVRELTDALNLL